ncbi:MAG: trigger factor [Chloroflexi bacterium]|nr:trigger factor [Chloroflexota bacterium]
MNIQTERLENHTARFTIELDNERLEQAKQTAARKLAQRVNVPGFRKGKAPYRILVNYVGEGAVLEEALDILGNEVYKQALDQSGIAPYGPGEIEDFQTEPQPTFKFIVPLQSEVDLKDYRSVRLDYTEPVVEDEDVNRSLKMLREQHALVEESHKPVALGNRVTLDIHAVVPPTSSADADADVADEKPETNDQAETETDEHDHAHDHMPAGEPFLHEHDAAYILSEDYDEPAPGFRDALVGANVGENREFELTLPDDEDDYGEIAGQKVKFHVTVKKIETITLPSLNDDFAARVTAEEEKPLTLLELRMRVRENLQKYAGEQAKSQYAEEALDKIVEQAVVSFSEAELYDFTEDYLGRLDNDLRRRGLTLEDYMRITSKSREDLHNDYREVVTSNLKRLLVLRQLIQAEAVTVGEQAVDEQIERILEQYGPQREGLSSIFKDARMRDSVRSELLEQGVFDRIVAIAKGEAPEAAPVESVVDETAAETTQGKEE